MRIQRNKRYHLRTKIFLMITAVSVPPILIIGLLIGYTIQNAHNQDVANIEAALIYQKIGDIRQFFKTTLESLRIQVAFEQTSDIEISSQAFLLQQILIDRAAITEASFINLSSGFETLRLLKKENGEIVSGVLRNQSSIKDFQKARDGQEFLSEIYFTANGPGMRVMFPVKNKNGIVVSVLNATIDLHDLVSTITATRLGAEGYIYLYDRDGVQIASSYKDHTSQNILINSPTAKNIISGGSYLGLPNQITLTSSLSKQEVIMAGAPIVENGWGIIVEWPTGEANQAINQLIFQIEILIFGVFMLALVGSYILATRIVRPIHIFESGASRVQRGIFNQPIAIQTGDELDDLGEAFNSMMNGLAELQKLKDEFVFIAAHELKTPVAATRGYLQLMREGFAGPINEKVKDYMLKLDALNQRLVQLVNDLLQVARNESGKVVITVSTIEISGPIKEVISELQPLLEEKKMSLVYDTELPIPKVLADATRVKEVMTNLISNAIKYTPLGGSIIITHKGDGDGNLITEIKDTGIGITPSAQKHLFEKFYRVNDPRAGEVSGTGLGLFIVKQIIEKMNGKIWVESEEGKGSIFGFSLKIAK